MVTKALELFSAYRSGKLPAGGGYVVSSATAEGSPITRFEIVVYREARSLVLSPAALTLDAAGDKVYVLVEPSGHAEHDVEPFRRTPDGRIPHRFSELAIVGGHAGARVLVSARPVAAAGPVTVGQPGGTDFAFLFLPRAGVLDSIQAFLAATFRDECLLPAVAARRAAAAVRACLARCRG